ncbi:hypothetical protein BD309DRAFT_1073986 [Dichomitus squalens]|uniref:Uncharacterized protein n=1 Tax=Dichomitus squalens TaxID=114155 RepID=A0A4Q9PHV1_9APHY|nr:hypothetical protein BD309DRAFT_1073986 [Dichomitus squalens]TBU53371.1 hypothetical protein BD310DRAFT_887928 [Dichomitus squalens]
MRRIDKGYGVSEKSSHLAGLRDIARFLPRQYTPYDNLNSMFVTGMTIWQLGPMSEADRTKRIKAVRKLKFKDAQYLVFVFEDLIKEQMIFRNYAEKLKNRPQDIMAVARFPTFHIHYHARAAHTSDIRTLKVELPKFFEDVQVAPDWGVSALSPVEFEKRERNCGLYSDCTARLLVNINERERFDRNGTIYRMKKLAETPELKKKCLRKHPETDENSSYPSFLFPATLQYDVNNPSYGLFKGAFFRKCVRTLLTGATSANQPFGVPGTGRSTLSKKHNIYCVTSAMIAYVASLVRFLLSEKKEWDGDDADGSGQLLHSALRDFLDLEFEAHENAAEDGLFQPGSEIEEINENVFAYYNRWIFGRAYGDDSVRLRQLQQKNRSLYDDDDAGNDDSATWVTRTIREQALITRKARLQQMAMRRLEQQDDTSTPQSSQGVSYADDEEPEATPAHTEDVAGQNSGAQDYAGGTQAQGPVAQHTDLETYCSARPSLSDSLKRFYGFGLLPLVPGTSKFSLVSTVEQVMWAVVFHALIMCTDCVPQCMLLDVTVWRGNCMATPIIMCESS